MCNMLIMHHSPCLCDCTTPISTAQPFAIMPLIRSKTFADGRNVCTLTSCHLIVILRTTVREQSLLNVDLCSLSSQLVVMSTSDLSFRSACKRCIAQCCLMHFTRVCIKMAYCSNQTAICSHASAAKGATARKGCLQCITYALK